MNIIMVPGMKQVAEVEEDEGDEFGRQNRRAREDSVDDNDVSCFLDILNADNSNDADGLESNNGNQRFESQASFPVDNAERN